MNANLAVHFSGIRVEHLYGVAGESSPVFVGPVSVSLRGLPFSFGNEAFNFMWQLHRALVDLRSCGWGRVIEFDGVTELQFARCFVGVLVTIATTSDGVSSNAEINSRVLPSKEVEASVIEALQRFAVELSVLLPEEQWNDNIREFLVGVAELAPGAAIGTK